jgi:hypothetical protein
MRYFAIAMAISVMTAMGLQSSIVGVDRPASTGTLPAGNVQMGRCWLGKICV